MMKTEQMRFPDGVPIPEPHSPTPQAVHDFMLARRALLRELDILGEPLPEPPK